MLSDLWGNEPIERIAKKVITTYSFVNISNNSVKLIFFFFRKISRISVLLLPTLYSLLVIFVFNGLSSCFCSINLDKASIKSFKSTP